MLNAWCEMCDVNSTDGAGPPGRLGAALILGFLAGSTAAIFLLAQGGGWLAALAGYSIAGASVVAASASVAVLRCHLIEKTSQSEPASG